MIVYCVILILSSQRMESADFLHRFCIQDMDLSVAIRNICDKIKYIFESCLVGGWVGGGGARGCVVGGGLLEGGDVNVDWQLHFWNSAQLFGILQPQIPQMLTEVYFEILCKERILHVGFSVIFLFSD